MGTDQHDVDGPEPTPEPEEPAIKPNPVNPASQEAQDKKAAGRQRRADDSFTGRAGQFAVMAELMRHRCNAAVPEVDLGTDVFAFRDDRAEVVRIQVKACTAPHDYADGSGFSAKFAIPVKQIRRLDDRPPLYYALAVLREDRWIDFLIVSRARMQSYYNGESRFGSYNKVNDDLEITVEFHETVQCSGKDLTDCRNAWKSLPPLQPLPDLDQTVQDQPTAEDGGADAANQPLAGPGQG